MIYSLLNKIFQFGITGHGGTVNNTTQIGSDSDRETIASLSRELGSTESFVIMALELLNEGSIPREQWPEKIIELVQRHKDRENRLIELEKQVSGLGADESDITYKEAIRKAREFYDHAKSIDDYDRVDEFFREAEEADLESGKKKFLRAASTRAERGELSLTRFNYLQAAEHFKKAAELVPDKIIDPEKEYYDYLNRYAGALYKQGDEKGDNAALKQAIEKYRIMINDLKKSQFHTEILYVNNELGLALWKIGEREKGTEKLEEAMVVYRDVLDVLAYQNSSLRLAMTKNNIGNVLKALGEREKETGKLEEAIIVYREALDIWININLPLEWAKTKNNIGGAFARLGEREIGTENLEQAIKEFRDALEEQKYDVVPFEWVKTKNNIGNVLLELGDRKQETNKVKEAINEYIEILEKITKDHMPWLWAITQINIGNALCTLGEDLLNIGEDDNGVCQLSEAIQAYKRALEVVKQEDNSLIWAQIQDNIGTAFRGIGFIKNDKNIIENAVIFHRKALEVFTEEETPIEWEKTQSNIVLASNRLDALINNSKLKCLTDNKFINAKEENKILFPYVIRNSELLYYYFINNDIFYMVFLDCNEQKRVKNLIDRSLDPFQYLITNKNLNESEINLNGRKDIIISNKIVYNKFSFFVGKDSSFIIENHCNAVKNNFINVEFKISLAYVISFGKEITKNNMYEWLEKLIDTSIKKWVKG